MRQLLYHKDKKERIGKLLTNMALCQDGSSGLNDAVKIDLKFWVHTESKDDHLKGDLFR